MADMSPEERRRRDEAVIAEFRRLRDAGDRRRLARAETGELVMYRPEEIGFVRGGAAKTVRTLAGLRVLGLGLGALAVLALVALAVTAAGPSGPAWPFLGPALLAAAGCAWALMLVGRERRAAALRRERGIPDPAKHPS
ncbi:hypothetical protein [Sinomonas halotolerans]|uniref:DUF3040 domain-containing protein n=1 Tax=Sinomonas halotolerans TaxID=1644133 RepID=A0ABU9WY80_9MICC